jgi:2,3-diketo-5-methylthio-1-phosphopentane phosphatase
VLVDFDGTIAPVDTTDLLLERFADPAWHVIEEEWKCGRIGSRECLVRQIDLVRASETQMESFIAGIEIDPGFPDFVRFCRQMGHSVTVVSDGLDRTIGAVLANYGLDLPHFANSLQWQGGDRWRLSFPHARSACQALSGNCKCQFSEGAPEDLTIVVGDGRSDFCVAGRADLVLAKDTLLAQVRAANLMHLAFRNFDEASHLLAGWLQRRPAAERANASARIEDQQS